MEWVVSSPKLSRIPSTNLYHEISTAIQNPAASHTSYSTPFSSFSCSAANYLCNIRSALKTTRESGLVWYRTQSKDSSIDAPSGTRVTSDIYSLDVGAIFKQWAPRQFGGSSEQFDYVRYQMVSLSIGMSLSNKVSTEVWICKCGVPCIALRYRSPGLFSIWCFSMEGKYRYWKVSLIRLARLCIIFLGSPSRYFRLPSLAAPIVRLVLYSYTSWGTWVMLPIVKRSVGYSRTRSSRLKV